MPAKGQKRVDIVGPLKEYFYRHPYEQINIYQLMDKLGFDKRQIQQAVINSLKDGSEWLEILSRGQVYRYTPPKNDPQEPVQSRISELTEEEESHESAMRTVYDGVTDDEKGFYMIQTSEDGNPILQRDHDGTIWLAVRV